jgi:hypothetical protein
MPRGPQGQKRPADVIGAAVMVAKIATGEAKEGLDNPKRAKAGREGGKARAVSLTPEQRAKAAKLAAEARWRRKR